MVGVVGGAAAVAGLMLTAPLLVLGEFGFECTNDACKNGTRVVKKKIHAAVVTPKGNNIAGGKGTVSGPGVFILRDIPEKCACKVKIPDLDFEVGCGDSSFIDKGLDVPPGDHEVLFEADAGSEACFKIFFDVTASVEEVTAEVLNGASPEAASVAGEAISRSVAARATAAAPAGARVVSTAENKPARKYGGEAAEVCDRSTFGVQMMIVEQLPTTHHVHETQLFMSLMALTFDSFDAGLAFYGGEGACWTSAVPVAQFPKPVMTDLSAAMAKAQVSTKDSPVGSPLRALYETARNGEWRAPADGKKVLRIALLDATSLPDTDSPDCPKLPEAEVAAALKEQNIAVVFFANSATGDAYQAFMENNGVAGYVQVLKPATSLISINSLAKKVEDNIKLLCEMAA